jgi:hypothetical protein
LHATEIRQNAVADGTTVAARAFKTATGSDYWFDIRITNRMPNVRQDDVMILPCDFDYDT